MRALALVIDGERPEWEFGPLAACTVVRPGEEPDGAEGVEKLYVARSENPRDPRVIASCLAKAARAWSAEVVLLDDSRLSIWVAGLVASKLECGAFGEVVRAYVKEGRLYVERPAYEETVLLRFEISRFPVIISMRGAKRAEGERGEVEELELEEGPSLEIVKFEDRAKGDLRKAKVVIGIGNGVERREFLKEIEELASVLGAEIGVSRPLIDSGWFPKELQIGFSGIRISPRLYLAIGISGAPYHVMGVKESERIVAINKDPAAPIFKYADYGLVADLYEAVPKLIGLLKGLKG